MANANAGSRLNSQRVVCVYTYGSKSVLLEKKCPYERPW